MAQSLVVYGKQRSYNSRKMKKIEFAGMTLLDQARPFFMGDSYLNREGILSDSHMGEIH